MYLTASVIVYLTASVIVYLTASVTVYIVVYLTSSVIVYLTSSVIVYLTALLLCVVIVAQTDWTKDPLTLCPSFDPFQQPDPCLFYEHFSIVFVDVTGFVNLCSDLSKGLYDRVRMIPASSN